MNSIDVPERVRGLLCALVYGWAPAPLTIGPVQSLRYGDIDVSDLAHSVELRKDRLRVTLSGDNVHRRVLFDMDHEIEGTLADGARFVGRTILHFGQRGAFTRATGMQSATTIEAADWTVENGASPSLWVGRIDGNIEFHHGGNLIVERVRPGRLRVGARRHLCVDGAYRYYLVRTLHSSDAIWHVLIDTGDLGTPDPSALGRDFIALQFVLGRQLRMSILLGLSPERRTVASTPGCSAWMNREDETFPPVPIGRNNDSWVDKSWSAVFFGRIVATMRARPELREAICIALSMYLDAMTNYLDHDYMRLQVALEAFAYALLEKNPQTEVIDVKDKAAWKAWVEANRDTIRLHAASGREEALYQKVLTAYRLSSGKVVSSAFRLAELRLTSSMAEELRGRDTIVHQGRMSPDGYKVDRDVRRIALVRTMLVALIARAVGYGGAINGWELGPQGYPLEPEGWWPVIDGDDGGAAHETFIAEEEAIGSD